MKPHGCNSPCVVTSNWMNGGKTSMSKLTEPQSPNNVCSAQTSVFRLVCRNKADSDGHWAAAVVLTEPCTQWSALLCRSKTGSDDKWATIAVLTEKGTKESASGRAYSIWRLSDLQGTNVSLFLFGKAQTGLWKETEGSIIAVFRPEVCSPAVLGSEQNSVTDTQFCSD